MTIITLRGCKEWPRHIYVLKDPRTGEAKYVGATINAERRLRSHLSDAVNKQEQPEKAAWINELLKSGLLPVMEVIETAPAATWGERERHWISTLRPPLNKTAGGAGMSGVVYSAETRVRMSEAQKVSASRRTWSREGRAIRDAALARGRRDFWPNLTSAEKAEWAERLRRTNAQRWEVLDSRERESKIASLRAGAARWRNGPQRRAAMAAKQTSLKRKQWAIMPAEERAERLRKMKDGKKHFQEAHPDRIAASIAKANAATRAFWVHATPEAREARCRSIREGMKRRGERLAQETAGA
jgi:hypothetical protein